MPRPSRHVSREARVHNVEARVQNIEANRVPVSRLELIESKIQELGNQADMATTNWEMARAYALHLDKRSAEQAGKPPVRRQRVRARQI